jgi:aminoglycoside phosphotransferase (APT) family kinase protein
MTTNHELNLTTLTEWMKAEIPGFSGPLTTTRFPGGQSNPTYRLHTPDRDYVLRRKPSGELVKGAHAIEREVRIQRALAPTGFPVPQIHGLCEDDTVIGSAFYIMSMISGRIFWDATLPEIPRDERAAYYDAMNATLAQLHQQNPIISRARSHAGRSNISPIRMLGAIRISIV